MKAAPQKGNVTNKQLPSFFVVGAQKAGTTSLHHWLSKQKGVFLPKNKETHFFSADEQFNKGLAWYLKQFPNGAGIFGEVASDYMFVREAPERMYKLVPDAKLIVILREPIQRAYSHYLMSVRNGYEPLSFYDALLQEPSRLREGFESRSRYSYLSRGLYSEQISRLKVFFSDENCMFIKFEELITPGKGNAELLRDIATFIGLKQPTFGSMSKGNPASTPYLLLVRDLLYKPMKLKRIFRLLIPSRDLRASIAHKVDIFNQRPVSKPSIGTLPREVVGAAYREVRALQALTGNELKDWEENLLHYDSD